MYVIRLANTYAIAISKYMLFDNNKVITANLCKIAIKKHLVFANNGYIIANCNHCFC